MNSCEGGVGGADSMALRVEECRIPGCVRIYPKRSADSRGAFFKVFQESKVPGYPLNGRWKEVFFSYSRKNVIRGFHVMGPPAEGFKHVTVVEGAILDVVLDLRAGSPTERQTCDWHLGTGDAVLVAPGVAHGFCVLSECAIVSYLVSSEHNESTDLGIRWDSVGFQWPCDVAVVSSKDQQLPRIKDFVTPFVYSR